MDLSSAQSGSKCSSDFSIERILSNDAKAREADVESPSWLCCTRYQPPRLPRASSGSACRSRRSGRHARVPFTGAQAAALEAAYARAQYLAPPALRALAAALQLRDDRIKIWFQNRRARERREKCANIAPPQAVPLPPRPPTAATQLSLPSTHSWMTNHYAAIESPQDLSHCSTLPATTVTQRPVISRSWQQNLRHLNKTTIGTSQDISHSSVLFALDSSGNETRSESEEDKEIDRPETPLDIESV